MSNKMIEQMPYESLFRIWNRMVGHNKWVFEIPVIITFYGWCMVVKSSIYLLTPQVLICTGPSV